MVIWWLRTLRSRQGSRRRSTLWLVVVTPAQFKSQVNKAKRQIRQAVHKYDREVRQYTAAARRAIDKHNRQVSAYNRRVRSNQRRLETELARLRRQRSTTRFVVTQTSTWQLHEAFTHVDQAATAGAWSHQRALLADLAEEEAANSARVTNTLLGNAEAAADSHEPSVTSLTDELSSLPPTLINVGKGRCTR